MHEETIPMLNELADLLDELPEERFDYSKWVGDDWMGDDDLSCGTTACAAGWATTLPSFRRRGLFLARESWGGIAFPAIEDEIGEEEAMAAVLDISPQDAHFLFLPTARSSEYGWAAPDHDATPREVAAHIRAWLAVATTRDVEPREVR
jgi:hypothetical protein